MEKMADFLKPDMGRGLQNMCGMMGFHPEAVYKLSGLKDKTA